MFVLDLKKCSIWFGWEPWNLFEFCWRQDFNHFFSVTVFGLLVGTEIAAKKHVKDKLIFEVQVDMPMRILKRLLR